MHLSIDPQRCTGCRLCEIACSLRHEGRAWPELARIRVLRDEPAGRFLTLACLPCEAQPCLAACPTPDAMRLQPDGALLIDETVCLGCGRCARACAIGAIRLARLDQAPWDGGGLPREWAAAQSGATNGQRAKGGKALALKCDRCGGDPACVAFCPTGALRLAGGPAQPLHDRLAAQADELAGQLETAARRQL